MWHDGFICASTASEMTWWVTPLMYGMLIET